MLEGLTDKMSQALRNLRGIGKLSEGNMADALKEVRVALLSADTHFKVVREFIDTVQKQCVGQQVLSTVTPGQQVIKIINDELIKLFGETPAALPEKKPLKVMMVGLHGSGKTTFSAKLACMLAKKKNYKPALIACDIYRPAAIDQLEFLAKQESFLSFADRQEKNVSRIGERGLAYAQDNGADLVIFDTAGRLQIDETLIQEIIDLKKKIQPDEVFLVADSALGQEAVNVAKHFHDAVALTGIVLTKLDGDTKGGAALSMKAITQVPIRFIGYGEKIGDADVFYPERMAQRILGMGDIVSLVEKAQEHIDEKEAQKLAEKLQKAEFNLEDFLNQIKSIKKMGPLSSLIGMLPGAGNLKIGDKEESQMKRTEAIISSMTFQERRQPNVLNSSRRERIAKGCGLQMKDVNLLLKQFQQMQTMMRAMHGSKGKKMMQQMQSLMGRKT